MWNGMRFALYLLGLLIVVIGVGLVLSATGIFGGWGGAIVAGIVVIVLGIGIIAASSEMWDSWGTRRRRRYREVNSGGVPPAGTGYGQPAQQPYKEVVRDPVTGATSERVVYRDPAGTATTTTPPSSTAPRERYVEEESD